MNSLSRPEFKRRLKAVTRLAVAVACVLALSIAQAAAQETWSPTVVLDGVDITINGSTTAVPNGPVLTTDPIFSGWDYGTFGNPPLLFPNGFAENAVTAEWIVADTYHGRLLRFATDHHPTLAPGAYLGEIPTAIGGGVTFPYGPVVDDAGTILIADIDAQAVKAFVPDGAGGYTAYQITTFADAVSDPMNVTTGAFTSPYRVALVRNGAGAVDVAAGVGSVVVLDAGANKVYKLTTDGGVSSPAWALQLQFGQSAEECGCAGPGVFNFPTGLSVDASGNIYVSDPNNSITVTIQVFDPNGNSIQVISDGLSTPWALSIAPDGRLFVADTGNNRIAIFTKLDTANPSQSLRPVSARIGSPSLPLGGVFLPGGPNDPGPAGVLQEPTSLAFDATGRLLVADTDNARIQIFQRLDLSIRAIALPQHVADTPGATVDVAVTISLADPTASATNVVPAIPTVSFTQAGGVGTPVVNPIPSCIVTPASSPSCGSLTASSIGPGGQLEYRFTFDKIAGTTGPAWFSVSATGASAIGDPISSAVVQTYAVAIDGTPPSNPPAITAGFSASNPPPTNGWYVSQPVVVDLNASMPDPSDGIVQEIEYAFGPNPPEEGDFYVCYNADSPGAPPTPSCEISVYKSGITTVWYRAFSSRGLYDTEVPYPSNPSITVPGWSSIDVALDYTEPIIGMGWQTSAFHGWFNELPAVAEFVVTDTESQIGDVTISASGANASWSFTPTVGVPVNSGTVTFTEEGTGQIDVSATDLAGNASGTTALFGIDVTPPTVDTPAVSSATALVPHNGSTWSRSPVVITFTGHDALSGFDLYGTTDTVCSRTVASGVGITPSCQITDWAGNSTLASAGPFSIDFTAPSVTAALPPGGIVSGATTWYSSAPASVDFTFDDGAGIGFAGGSTETVTAAIVGGTASASLADLVGNSATGSAGPFAVDADAPTVTTTPDFPGTLVAGTPWYGGPLHVRFDADDNGGAGFPGGTQYIQESVLTSGPAVTRSYSDVLGHTATATAGPYNVDTEAPVVSVSYQTVGGAPLSGVPVGGTLYFGGPFKAKFTAVDAGAGFSNGSSQLTAEQTYTVSTPAAISATFKDLLQHSATATAGPFGFDTAPPSYTFTTSPAGVLVGATRWYQAEPSSVTFLGDDGPAGVGFAGGAQTFSATVPVVGGIASAALVDRVGNTANATAGPFSVDAIPPSVVATPDTPDALVGATPWYAHDVSVLFTATDGGSGLVGPAAQTLVSNGASVSASFQDAVGNSSSASAGPFNIDAAGPAVSTSITYTDNTPATGVLVAGTTWFNQPVTVTMTATDAGAGFSTVAPQADQTFMATVSGASQPVTHLFEDVLGNATSGVAGPYGVDSVAPTLVTADIIVAASTPAANPTAAIVTFSPPASDDVDPSPSVSCSPASGFAFPFGTTTVECTATDAVGNSRTGSFTVTVEDHTNPVLTVPSAISQIAFSPTAISFATSAVDNLDTAPSIVCSPESGSVFPLGITTVSCTATDASGNVDTKTFAVTLASTPPTVIVPESFSVQAAGPGGAIVTYTATASDVIDGAIAPTCAPASGSLFPLGPTAITCTATNSGLLSTSRSFVVTVIDTLPPALTQANIAVVATSPAGAIATFAPTVSDIVDGSGLAVTCSRPSGSTFPIGSTPVTCSSTDSHGNTGSVTFTVDVLHSAPVCSAAAANPGDLWPPNHRFVAIGVTGITNADGTPVALTISSIYQDEPTNGLGDGDTPLDGQGVGTGTARVRSERSGTANGRVYYIGFAASTSGGSCTGTVTVGVPHDQGQGPAVGEGPLYDSTKAPPTAVNDSVTAKTAVAVAIQVLKNDSDPAGYALTVTAVSTPTHGTVTLAGNIVTYKSAAGYTGSDSFTYTVDNGHGGSATATVNITVKKK